MTNRCQAFDKLCTWRLPKKLGVSISQANFIHFRKTSSINLINKLSASYIPNLNSFISANRNRKRSIIRHFDGINIALMAQQISNIWAWLSIPDFDIGFQKAARQ